jgi:tetratricopeptide (TPR) repeat protein
MEAQVLVGMGSIYIWSDQQERGVAYLEAALPLSRMLDDKITEMELLNLLSMQSERRGDYTQMLTEYHEKRLQIAREIGHLPLQASALMHCGQIQSIYLGDHEQGLNLLHQAEEFWRERTGGLFVLLRIVQVLTAQARYDEAMETLERARVLEEQTTLEMGHAGFRLVTAFLYNALGDRVRVEKALVLADEARQLVANRQFLSRQYEMAANVASSTTHLTLATYASDDVERQTHYERALMWSQAAHDLYQALQGVQIIECTSEQILFCHSRALAANGHHGQAREYAEHAYNETMRKAELIPADSAFRQTFLQNIPLHLLIQDTCQGSVVEATPDP